MMVYFSVLPYLANFKTLPEHIKPSVMLTKTIIYIKKKTFQFHFISSIFFY